METVCGSSPPAGQGCENVLVLNRRISTRNPTSLLPKNDFFPRPPAPSGNRLDSKNLLPQKYTFFLLIELFWWKYLGGRGGQGSALRFFLSLDGTAHNSRYKPLKRFIPWYYVQLAVPSAERPASPLFFQLKEKRGDAPTGHGGWGLGTGVTLRNA